MMQFWPSVWLCQECDVFVEDPEEHVKRCHPRDNSVPETTVE